MEKVAGALAFRISVDEDTIVSSRLDYKLLIPGVVIVTAFAHLIQEVNAFVSEVKRSLVKVLVIIKRPAAEH